MGQVVSDGKTRLATADDYCFDMLWLIHIVYPDNSFEKLARDNPRVCERGVLLVRPILGSVVATTQGLPFRSDMTSYHIAAAVLLSSSVISPITTHTNRSVRLTRVNEVNPGYLRWTASGGATSRFRPLTWSQAMGM